MYPNGEQHMPSGQKVIEVEIVDAHRARFCPKRERFPLVFDFLYSLHFPQETETAQIHLYRTV